MPARPGLWHRRAAVACLALLTISLCDTTLTQWLWFGGLAAAPDITRGMCLFFLEPLIAACLAISILAQLVTRLRRRVVTCAAVAPEAGWPRVLGGSPAAARAR